MSYELTTEREFFLFKVDGHEYKFFYPTAEESFDIDDLRQDNKSKEIIGKMADLVEKSDPNADYPEFKQVYLKLNSKQLLRFNEMVQAELRG